MTNLTTLAACKQEFGIASATTTWDGVLASEIARASGLIASACEREFGVTARVERYDAHGQRTLNLRQYPIVTDPLQGGQAVDIRQDTTWAFAAATIIPTTEYYVDAATGEVTFLYALARGRAYGESGALADPTDSANGTTGVGRKAVQVTYTSGYVTIPDALAAAATRFVAILFNKRKSGGLSNESLGNKSVGYEKWAGPLPDEVDAMIQPFRRMTASQ